jgi:hypothetical protein
VLPGLFNLLLHMHTAALDDHDYLFSIHD